MGKTTCDVYEEWDLSPLSTPVRSTLYALEPIGVGTPGVESLTSYIARLADAHGVFPGILMEKLIAPLMPGYLSTSKMHPLYRSDGNKSNLLNATGPRANHGVQALEAVTLRTDLRHLTLLAFGEIVYIKGLIRLTKAWCPVCYHEWRTTGQMVYDPLLWVLQEVSICVRHQQPLQVFCPYQDCQHALPALAWRSQPGYCTYCQRWLGMSLEQVQTGKPLMDEAELIWQQWVTHAWGTVFAAVPAISMVPRRQQVSEVLTYAVKNSANGNISAFARALGQSDTQIGQWMHNKKIPQADMLLRLCHALGLSLCEMFFCAPDTLHPSLRNQISLQRSWRRRPGIPVNRESLCQILESILAKDEYPPPSLKEVGQRLGHEPTFLYQCARTLCFEISARYKAYCHQRKEERMQGYREEIRSIALELWTQGIPVTQGRLAPYLIQPAILRNPEVREILEETRRELEENT